MADSFTYNGTDFDATYGIKVLNWSMPIMSDVRLDLHEQGGADGAIEQASSYKPRFMTLACVIEQSTRELLFTKYDLAMAALDPTNGKKLLILDHETGISAALNRGYYAMLNGPVVVSKDGNTSKLFNLTFVVPEGHAVSATESSQSSVSIDSDPKTIYEPAASGTVVRGTTKAKPVIVLQNDHSVAVTSVKVTNETTDEAIQWAGSLSTGDQLKIDTARHHLEKSTDSGSTWSNAMTGIHSTNNVFPRLQDGVQNEFTIVGFTTGSLDITYRGVFL